MAVNYANKVMYLGNEAGSPIGFIALDGVNPIVEGIATDSGVTQSDNVSFRIQPDIQLFNKSLLAGVDAVVWKDRVLVTVPYGTTSTANTRIYCYDFVRRDQPRAAGAWFPWDSLAISYFVRYNNKLLGTSAGTGLGKMIELDVAGLYTDQGSAINSYYSTKFFNDKKYVQNHKDFRNLYIRCGLTGNYPLNVYRKVDFQVGSGDLHQLSLASSQSLWGTAVWGVSLWGGGFTEKEFDMDLGKSSGRRIQFKFTNGNVAAQAFRIAEGAVEYILRTRRNIRE